MLLEELDLCKQTKNLTKDQIAKLSKSKVSLPKDFSDFLETVGNFAKELKIITSGDSSILYKNFTKVIDAITQNSCPFKSCIACNKLFITHFLYKVDLHIQCFLTSCTTMIKVAALNWEAIDFNSNMKKILIYSKDIFVTIPSIIHQLIDKQGSKGSKDDGKHHKPKDDKNPGGRKNPKGKRLKSS
jgi:hypothetical protein